MKKHTWMRVIIMPLMEIRWMGGERIGHITTCISSHASLKGIHGALQVTLNGCSGQYFTIMLIAMASTDHNSIPSPMLHSICPPQAAEPCSCIVMGSRCWILNCVDLGNGYHFSHTRLCNLTLAQTSFTHSLLSHSANLPTNSFASNTVMARTRH